MHERDPQNTSRARLSPPAAFAAAGAVIGVALYASATPSPLYGIYQAQWHFSTAVLTLIYASYSVGVLASLLLLGGLSDQAGRRPVLTWSLGALLASMGLFLAADSVAWLFAARIVQGLATGAVLGAAGAALIDLHPSGDSRHAALVNGVASSGGIAAGALVSAVLVQFLPDPRTLPFVLVATVVATLLLVVRAMPEPVRDRRPLKLRPQRPGVPHSARSPFALAAIGVLASWSIGGLYLALGPELAGRLLGTRGELAGGLAVVALAGPAALAQLAGRDLSNRTLTTVGASLLAAGMALMAGAVAIGSAALFFPTTALAGIGFGMAFMGALRHLTNAIPDGHRSAVMSAFYVVAYLSLSVPAIAAGLVARSLGLPHTFELFSACVVVLAMLVAAGGRRLDEPALGVASAVGAPAGKLAATELREVA